jgi:chemotaxis signal transduction protein
MTGEAEGTTEHLQVLTVQVDGVTYGLETGHVDRVGAVASSQPLPRSSEAVLGSSRERGQVVVYLDAGILVGDESAASEAAVVLDAEEGNATVALVVDSVLGTDTVPTEALEPAGECALDDAVFAASISGDGGPTGLFGPERLRTLASESRETPGVRDS